MPKHIIDPRILALCNKVTSRRPQTVINHIIKHGAVTTEELQKLYGYDHPPRAVRDVRERGIPIKTSRVRSKTTGRMIASYSFDSPDNIIKGRIGGRKTFSRHFKNKLITQYGERDTITGERCHPRYLQIDHRVPYEVAGESTYDENHIGDYMLLDASSQRAKSWSCEQCENWQETHDEKVCRSCFWAFPESYTHIAGEHVRRVDIQWKGDEIEVFERIQDRAKTENITIASYIKRLLEKFLTF